MNSLFQRAGQWTLVRAFSRYVPGETAQYARTNETERRNQVARSRELKDQRITLH